MSVVPIATLAPGTPFVLAGEVPIRGVVVLRNTSRVRVRLEAPAKRVEFTDKEGRHFDFESTSGGQTDWSGGTLVFKEEDVMGETATAAEAAVVKNPRLVAFKQKMAAKKVEGAKPAAKPGKTAKPAKPAKEKEKPSLKPCGCGCGEQVTRRFKPGHDARFYGWLRKVADGRMKFEELSPFVRKQVGDIKAVKALVKEHFEKE